MLLLPLMCKAQLVEFSVKGGAMVNRMLQDNMNTLVKNPVGYAGSFAATVSFPGAVRLGFAVSAYDVKADVTFHKLNNNGYSIDTYTGHMRFGEPLVPVEAMLIKRFNPGRVRIDIGGTIGTCLNRTISLHHDDSSIPDGEHTDKTYKWRTYGALLGLQFRIGYRSGIGFEVQPKWLKIGPYSPAFAMPVMAKYCFYII
jgi:hypothetical protein